MNAVTYEGAVTFSDGEEVTISIRIWMHTFTEITVKLDNDYYGAMDGHAFSHVDVSVDLDSGRVLVYKRGEHKNVLAKGFTR